MTVRFEHTVEDAQSLRRAFVGVYWAIAALLALGGIVRRELLVIAAAFSVVLFLWQRSMQRAMPTQPWVLEIDRDHVAVDRNGVVERVERAAATGTRLVRRHARGASWWELQVLGPKRRRLLREGLRDDHRAGVVAALADHGWPTSDRS